MPGDDGPERDAPGESRAARVADVPSGAATGWSAASTRPGASPSSARCSRPGSWRAPAVRGRTRAGADTVQLSVAQPAGAPAAPARPADQTIYKTVLVTPSPQPPAARRRPARAARRGPGIIGIVRVLRVLGVRLQLEAEEVDRTGTHALDRTCPAAQAVRVVGRLVTAMTEARHGDTGAHGRGPGGLEHAGAGRGHRPVGRQRPPSR